jgi:polyhydroxyalkanoate synthase
VRELEEVNRKLVKGELEIGGKRVDLKKITMPLLNIYATEDHLVPPASSIPLNDLVGSEDKTLYSFPGGHIGIYVSSQVPEGAGPPCLAVADRALPRAEGGG